MHHHLIHTAAWDASTLGGDSMSAITVRNLPPKLVKAIREKASSGSWAEASSRGTGVSCASS